ncbi:MAG: type II toxin-antitoxin system VapC family toxin [Deltaproteobacteria bacterium]|nr:type II toxin-antitoxin system VapC family toxin [Deltaproteobacteria bacterium]MDP3028552.1 type II toxin-antitoxin system VapC family toxin [Deltaproteobacteria bacterium]
MRTYVFDTDIAIYWLKGNEQIRNRVLQVGPDNLRITIITLAELHFGAYNSQKREQNLSHIRDFLRKVTVLSFDEKAADRFGQVKATLRKSGEIIEDFDILIASIAIVQNAVLVTNNTNHFERIPGLHLENWLKQ